MTPRELLSGVTTGSFIASGSEVIADLMGSTGFDWLLMDLEHGFGDEVVLGRQVPAVRVHGIPCLARIEAQDRIRIGRALDLGVDGIMIPRVESRSVAETLVRWAQFPLDGERGVASSTRAAMYGRTPVGELNRLDAPFVVVQIESPQAVEQASAIAAVPGIDALFVGPADLTSSLGIPGEVEHPDVDRCLERVLEAAQAYDKTPGIMARSPADVARFRAMGFRLIALSSDLLLLANACRTAVQAINPSTSPVAH